ncbi:MAG: TIGR01777 family protein [Sphingobacteriales bacterium]|nr:MAG: TIGR01777 family protein [Sphingobacteriales bacterium]
MPTTIITGGTGLIGKKLSAMLVSKGHDVVILTRKPRPTSGRISYAAWDVDNGTVDEKVIASADYVIHLAGAGVADKKWTDKRKQEIVDSRVKSGLLLVNILNTVPNNVKAFVSSSAIGWYGEDPTIPNPSPFTETMPAGEGFLGETCELWEQSLDGLLNTRIRLVKLRTGIVLSNDGGAYAEFKKPVKMGIAGILGNGKQVISWIHIEDMCRMYLYAIENELVSGVYNATAPNPVSNKELTLTLAHIMKGRFYVTMHVPTFVLKMMLGERSVEILKSTTVSSAKIKDLGFSFIYPSIESAIQQLVKEQIR